VIAADGSFEVVGVAEDAAQAIELARRHRPQVALVDVRMPGGGGAHAVREIRSCSPETRVVILSAYGDRSSVFEMLRAGATGYLVKGASVEEILETLRRSSEGESVLSPEVTGEVVHELAGQLEQLEDAEARWGERIGRVRMLLGDGGLDVRFQPIVELAEGRTVGFEALARFPLEQDEAPGYWFEEAAAVGLRTELELAALEAALAHAEQLPAGAFLSVNVSPQAALSPSVLRALGDAPLERVVIEVTEHAQVDDYDALNRALREPRAAGARLAIDDAGAGFASLRHVLRLSPDLIKLDASLIGDLERTSAARALASALIAFAREMDITVVAEGVESAALAAELAALGVRYGQGRHLGEPAELPVSTQCKG
jgi:EAL domain-containing protein (putative c-di-GMP-specific phosphodiesterase class I)